MDAAQPLLSLKGIRKRFGTVEALRGIDLDVRPGEVLGLLGDNGAGKSTLIKTIAGVHAPSAGEMHFAGARVEQFSPDQARALGIETLYQDLALAANLDVSLNVFLGREVNSRLLGVLPRMDRVRMRQETRTALDRLKIHIPDLSVPVGTLSGGQQQAVAIARAVYWRARLVILDEPTAALGVSEHDIVMQLVTDLAASGVAVILITHAMTDALAVTHRIAVLTRGEKALDQATAEITQERVIEAMLFGARA